MKLLFSAFLLAALTACNGCAHPSPPIPASDPVPDVAAKLELASVLVGNLEAYLDGIASLQGPEAHDLTGWETCLAASVGRDTLHAASASAAGWAVSPAIQGFTVDYTKCLPSMTMTTPPLDAERIAKLLESASTLALVSIDLSGVDARDPCAGVYLRAAFKALPSVAAQVTLEVNGLTRTGRVLLPTIPLATAACHAGG